MFAPGGGNRLNKLTGAPVLPEGWHKVSAGLWRHDNGEESRINPSSMFTNSNFSSLKSAESFERGGGAQDPADSSDLRPPPPPPRPLPPPLPATEQQSAAASSDKWWYIGYDDVKHGPVSSEGLSRLYDSGLVQAMTYVWSHANEGKAWLCLKDSSLRYVPSKPAAGYGPDAQPQPADGTNGSGDGAAAPEAVTAANVTPTPTPTLAATAKATAAATMPPLPLLPPPPTKPPPPSLKRRQNSERLQLR